MKNWFLLLVMWTSACNSPQNSSDASTVKEQYLKAAVKHIPNLTKHYSKIALGHINDDNLIDGFIEYGEGEGMRPTSRKIVMVLKEDGSKLGFFPFETDYCISIDTIIDRKLLADENADCFDSHPPIIAKHHIYLDGTEIRDEIYWSLKEQASKAFERLRNHVIQEENLAIHNLIFENPESTTSHGRELRAMLKAESLKDIDLIAGTKITTEKEDEQSQISINLDDSILTLRNDMTFRVDSDLTTESTIVYKFQLIGEEFQFIDHTIAG